jgi:RHS repeat-associated protein
MPLSMEEEEGGPAVVGADLPRYTAGRLRVAWPCIDVCKCQPQYCPGPGGGGGGGREGPTLPEFNLLYASQTTINRAAGNWWFPYDIYVVPQPNGNLHYYSPGVAGAVYQWNAVTQTFASPPGYFDAMVANPNGTWTRTTKHGDVWQFNTGGHLVSVTSRYGLSVQFNRNAQQAITSIADHAGRAVTVAYNAAGYISSLTDWGGRTTTFTYTPEGYLASVTRPATTFYDRQAGQIVTRARTETFTYTTGTGTSLDGNLLGMTDDAGQAVLANTYDAQDRHTAITLRGRTWQHTYLANGSTQVVDPDGVTTIYSFSATGAIARKEVLTKTGLGQPPLRPGEPNSYVWLYERNAACGCELITKITHPDGKFESFTYDVLGNMLSHAVDPPPGAGGTQVRDTWTYSPFAQFSLLLTHTRPGGYAPGAAAADHTTTWTRNGLGSVTQVQTPKATVNGTVQQPTVSYAVNAVGLPLTCTWPSGRQDTYQYAPATYELAQVVHDSAGLALQTTYGRDIFGRVTSVTNPRGHTTTYTYNALDQLVEWAGPQPKSPRVTWLYDNLGNIYRREYENKDSYGVADPANPWFTTTTAYDLNNFHVGTTVEVDATTTATTAYEWTPGGRLKKITDPNGDVVELQYDERGLVFKIIEAPGTSVAGTTQVDYDLNGRPSRIVDPRGNATLSAYDHADRTTCVTFADLTKLVLGYDLDGNVLTAERADSAAVVRERTTWTFDPYGLRLTSARHHLDSVGSTTQTDTTSLVYDSGLRLKTSTDPLGNSTSITWDGVSRVSVIQDAATNKVELTYDANGNATVVKRFDWNQVTSAYDQIILEHAYDALDRRTATTRRDQGNTLSSSTAAEYDGRGLPTRSIDELGNTIRHEWDARGLLVKTLRDLRAGGTGAGAITGTITNLFQYDLGGRTLSLTDGLNNATTYEYDARSRVKKVTNAAGQYATYAFDANGNVVTATDPNGSVVASTWDVMDRLTAQSATPASGVLGDTTLGIAYDPMGRPTQITDNDSTIVRSYDSLGRLVSETQGPNPLGSSGKTFAFLYSAAGFNTAVTYPDGTVEQRNRDAIGRLSSVAVQGGATLGTYQYAGSRVPSLALPNGVTRTQTYDALLRRTMVEYRQGAAPRKKFEYVYNLADYRLLEKRHHSGGTGDNYSLDSIYRSVQVKAGVADPVAEHQNPGSQAVASTTGVAYDAAQNRSQVVLTVGGTPTTTNYTADALNFYTAVGGTTHVRDPNGNLKDDGTNLYDYDRRNQLVRIRRKSDLAVIGTYAYDGTARRIAKSTASGTTTFWWIGFELAMEYDASGLVSRRHRGAGFAEVVSAQQRDFSDLDQDGSTTDFVPLAPLYDGAYDCVGVLDHTGAVAESYVHAYDGAATITNAAGTPIASSAVGWHQGYGRMYRDAESGLLYAVHRYYDPGTGRFATEDPLGRWFDGFNTGNGYGWVANRYVNRWDPLGLADRDVSAIRHDVWQAAYNAYGNPQNTAEERGFFGAIFDSTIDTDVSIVNDSSVNQTGSRSGTARASTEPRTKTRDGARDGRYWTRIGRSHWDSASRNIKILILFHEFTHPCLWKQGRFEPHHPPTDPWSLYFYNVWVIDTLRALRDRARHDHAAWQDTPNMIRDLTDTDLQEMTDWNNNPANGTRPLGPIPRR